MNSQSKSSVSRSVALGAMLLLAATASGCGVGLPTQPDVDAGAVSERSAGAAGVGWVEIGEPLGDSDGSITPAGEIVIPPASGPRAGGGGWAYGHQKKKLKNR